MADGLLLKTIGNRASARPHSIRNRLLKAMSPNDFAMLQPHLELVPAPPRLVLIKPGATIDYLYFPERGFTSLTADAVRRPVEVGMIGREGLVGASPILLGDEVMPYRAFVQIGGENLRIPTVDFRRAVAGSDTLRTLLLRYVQSFLIQVTQTTFANSISDIETRLMRWLLMCRDRSDDDQISITHGMLSMLFGVRRPGITNAISNLGAKGLIKGTRGTVTIIDRKKMMVLANGIYGTQEAEYARLVKKA